MQNVDLYKFGFHYFRSSNDCNSALHKSKLCRGCLFSNAVKIMIFKSDAKYYAHIKLYKTAESIHLFKIIGTLKYENIKLN